MKKIYHSAIGGSVFCLRSKSFGGQAGEKHSAFCILHSAFFQAFTLVELLIVMVVISILVGITLPLSKYVTRQARLANQRIYIEKIKSALEDYRAAYGEYPITPSAIDPATGFPTNYDDVARHYPPHYATGCTNSPSVNVDLAVNTVENITNVSRQIDYCLTWPLMLKQRAVGARPFMDFKDVTVAYLVYNPKMYDDGGDTYTREDKIKTALGPKPVTIKGIKGSPINRAKAIDPVSKCQWKYTSSDGVTYNLATNGF